MEMETILLIIMLIIGLVLAFFGIKVWETLMGIIGGFIGWFIGFGLGMYYFESDPNVYIYAIIIGLICGFIGSMLFHYLVEAAMALVVAALGGGVVYYMGGETPEQMYLIAAIIVFVVVFALAFYFMDELIGVFTAMIGAILAGAALYLLMDGDPMSIILGIVIFISGAALQTFVLTD